MGDRVWQVPQDQFVAVWNGSESLGDASARIKEIVGARAPGWALVQRALELRKAGIEMKALVRPAPLQRVEAMDVFKFVKLPNKANDPLRRYAVASGIVRVGDLEVLPPNDGSVVLTAEFKADLSDAAREDALNTALRFLDELALGWGVHLLEEHRESEERPNGSYRSRVTFRTA